MGAGDATWHSEKSRIPFARVPTSPPALDGTAPSRPSWLRAQGPRDRPSEPHAAHGGHSIHSWARHQGNSTPTAQRLGQGGREQELGQLKRKGTRSPALLPRAGHDKPGPELAWPLGATGELSQWPGGETLPLVENMRGEGRGASSLPKALKAGHPGATSGQEGGMESEAAGAQGKALRGQS